ncbi:hypothetical protein MBLNU459_g6818t1 [Dothideomycetes sp. NU459]
MVLLTVTPAARTAIQRYNRLNAQTDAPVPVPASEPSLADPAVGDAISHAQILRVARLLKEHCRGKASEPPSVSPSLPVDDSFRLDALLKGAKIYTPPPRPKAEPTLEYKALMARLREEEEQRAYERMINPPAPLQFANRAPTAMYAIPDNMPQAKEEDDDVTYADVNRQLALIINVLVSIIACSVAIWIAARHWSVPQRLALSMTGSGVVAVAEVVIYMGYIRRVREAKATEGSRVETKEVVETWVIDSTTGKKALVSSDADGMRHRKGKHR